jgi:hypothetical protein
MSSKSILRPIPLSTLLLAGSVLAHRAGLAAASIAFAGPQEGSGVPVETPAPSGQQPANAPGVPPVGLPLEPPVPAAAAHAVPPSAEQVALYRERLSRNLAQRARSMLQREFVFLGMLESGQSMLEDALKLAPDNPFLWRLALDYAVTLEDGSPEASAMLRQALSKLSKLEPDDESIRLRRLLAVVEDKQTFEERAALYRQLLAPDSVQRIGRGVAARLAFDFALLLRRNGDQSGFEGELIHALDLDPYFPEAAEFAAGYFRMNAPDPAAEASALRQALLANPTREPAALGLAELCLKSGAYRAAASILNVEASILETDFPDLDFDAILTDLVIASWGSGDKLTASAAAQKRQDSLNRVFRQTLERQGTTLSVEDRRKLAYPMSMQLASAYAALVHSDAPEAVAGPIKGVQVSTETTIRAMEEGGASAEEKARLALEGAFVQLWLDGDVAFAKDQIRNAAGFAPLSDVAQARFDGWIALREGDAARAKELLGPIAEQDVGARLGLALAEEKSGDVKAAARHLLEVARANPAAVIGLWSRDRLRRLLGAEIDVIPNAADVESASQLPPDFLDLMSGAAGKILLRIQPRTANIAPWDPMIFDIEISNRSRWPLAITPDGPVADTATVTANVNVPGQRGSLPPFALLSLNRRFAIPPGESMKVPVDISLTDASFAMRDDALSGAFVSIHPIVNWRTTDRGLEPGPLGVEAESPLIHVRGEKISVEWIEQSKAMLRDTSRTPDPERMAAFAGLLLRASKEPTRLTPEERSALEGTGELLADAARRLWPEARAWLIYAIPKGGLRELSVKATDLAGADAGAGGGSAGGGNAGGADAAGTAQDATQTTPGEEKRVVTGLENVSAAPELAALDAVLAGDDDPLVRVSWISVRVKRPEDPILARTMEHPDARTARFARNFQSWMNDVQAERRRRLNLSK